MSTKTEKRGEASRSAPSNSCLRQVDDAEMHWRVLLSILLADPAACTPFIAARTQPAERLKVGLVPSHGAENTLGRKHSGPSIRALILATLFETVLHQVVCSSPHDAGTVLMMTPASAAAPDEAADGARAADVGLGQLVVQMAQSYFRGLATLVRMLLRQPEAPQALMLVAVLGYASQLAMGPSLARSGARLSLQVQAASPHPTLSLSLSSLSLSLSSSVSVSLSLSLSLSLSRV